MSGEPRDKPKRVKRTSAIEPAAEVRPRAAPISRSGEPLPRPSHEASLVAEPEHGPELHPAVTFQMFMPPDSPKARVTLALAAFRVGYLGRAMWARAGDLWYLLFSRSQGHFWHEGSEHLIPVAIEQFYDALEARLCTGQWA